LKWITAGKSDLNSLVDFILEKEWEHTFFSSRMIRNGEFILPKKSKFPILLLKDRNRIKAACMITSWGGIFPVFKSMDLPDELEIKALVFWFSKNLKRIYSIMGTEERVSLLTNNLKYKNGRQIDYNLMIREHDHIKAAKPEIKNLSFLKACPDDSAVLLGMELEYQKEEVFLNPSLIKNSQIYHNLRSTLNEQVVYYINTGIIPIAKAGTNAIGHKWNQIGGVYTEKNYRNQGVSTWLMDKFLEIVEKDGKKTVLFVKESNIAAERVYNKLGFETRKKFKIIYYI